MLHLLEDVLGWAAVLVGGIIMYFFDLPVIDPLLSVGIMLFVVYNVFRNLRRSLTILLQGTPPDYRLQDIKEQLERLPEIGSVHYLHLWTLDGIHHILTLHALTNANLPAHKAAHPHSHGRTQHQPCNHRAGSARTGLQPAALY